MPGLAIPRESIPWHPAIDYGLCTADQECLKFCRHDVFEWDEGASRVAVANPTGCIVGCDACTQICPVGAISFPSKEELRDTLRRLRAERRTAA